MRQREAAVNEDGRLGPHTLSTVGLVLSPIKWRA